MLALHRGILLGDVAPCEPSWLEGVEMTSTNALEWTVNYHGALCPCESAAWPAAHPGR